MKKNAEMLSGDLLFFKRKLEIRVLIAQVLFTI